MLVNMRWARTVVPFGLVYVVVGIVSAALAGSATSIQGRNAWRMMAWAVSLLAFGAQFLVERVHFNNTTLRSALHNSAAVALGALVLAAAGPVRAHWGTDSQQQALTALFLWPALTGVASFLVALGAGSVLARISRTRSRALVAALVVATGHASVSVAQAPIVGTWRGTSTCVDKVAFPGCNDEVVVYVVRALGASSDSLAVRGDRVVGGAREFMGELHFGPGQSGAWQAELLTARFRGRWTLAAQGDHLAGTLVDLPSGRLERRVSLQRLPD
jgi:hypothetical protein